MRDALPRFAVAIVAAALLAFGLHVVLGQTIQGVVADAMKGKAVAQPPYGVSITVLAALTSLVPATALAVVFYMFGEKIPGRTRIAKGALLGVALLAIKGELVRTPVMAIAIGNPVWIALLQQSERWIANLTMAVWSCLTSVDS